MSSNDPHAEILGIIRRINAAWREGPPSEIVARVAPCLAQDMVMCSSNLQAVARGRNASVASESGHDVRVFSRHDAEWRAVWRAMLPAPT